MSAANHAKRAPYPGAKPISSRSKARRPLSTIILAHDVVAVEDAARLVTGDRHDDPFGRAGTDDIANRLAAEIADRD